MVSLSDLDTVDKPTWCPGCGNFSILTALKKAIVELKLEPHNVLVVSGVGCSGHLPQWINTYGFHSLHGRALPVATGARLANKDLTVIAVAGDGDAYGIGMSHFINAIRRNVDINYIVHDNQVYGLTTGQASPTSPKGFVSKSTPFGSMENPVNPIALAIGSGASFVARGFAGDVAHLTKLFVEGIKHKGFALIDVLQPCVTFNNTYEYFSKRVYKLEDIKTHNPTNRLKAYEKAHEWGEKIPIGVFYKEHKKTYEEEELTMISKIPLIKQKIDNINISKLMDEFV